MAKELEIEDLKTKYLKHRQILYSNYEMSEAEVKKLDEIYHETVHKVLKVGNLNLNLLSLNVIFFFILLSLTVSTVCTVRTVITVCTVCTVCVVHIESIVCIVCIASIVCTACSACTVCAVCIMYRMHCMYCM